MLPDPIVLALTAFIGFLITEGLKDLGALVKVDLSGYGAALTAAVVAFLVALFNGALGLVPPQYQTYVQAVIAALVVILGSFGVHRVAVRFGGHIASG